MSDNNNSRSEQNSTKAGISSDDSKSESVEKQPLLELDKHQSALSLFFRDKYAIYVVGIITFVYASVQLNRYILTSVSLDMEREVGFGEGDGESFLYAMLAGPITTLPFCLGCIICGHLGDNFNQVHVFV